MILGTSAWKKKNPLSQFFISVNHAGKRLRSEEGEEEEELLELTVDTLALLVGVTGRSETC